MSQDLTPPAPPLLLDARDLAVALNLSVITIRRMRADGSLPPPLAIQGRRSVRWRRSDLETWLAGIPTPAAKR